MKKTTHNLTESAHVGEELLGGARGDLYRKCWVAKQSLQDGLFSLDEALENIGISREQYEEFIAQNTVKEIQVSLSGAPPKDVAVVAIHIMSSMTKSLFVEWAGKTADIIRVLNQLSDEIKKEKDSSDKSLVKH